MLIKQIQDAGHNAPVFLPQGEKRKLFKKLFKKKKILVSDERSGLVRYEPTFEEYCWLGNSWNLLFDYHREYLQRLGVENPSIEQVNLAISIYKKKYPEHFIGDAGVK